ncbi:glycosyltransferase [Acaryochloris sp. CCMEE 5410]|uniref:glycosyltransferase n=1 Tax=Acaryochloris sp. CCMEE 5410 TaxID=310037 RepID=UPI0002483B8E|nr:glycosyltransferase [Acaryochloris sp. CCMEE 5410]KAI9132417.1 glycosyltransferase [Acaryochloris sp. CCMEE 5410]
MLNPSLTIFYQIDPLDVSIGGIQTTVLNFIKYAPQDFDIRLVGITSRKECSIGSWQTILVLNKQIQYLPILYIEDDNIRGLIPTTLKFLLALFGKDLNSDFLHFHRIEPSLASFSWHGEKTLFIHADIKKQVNGQGGNKTFLWRYLPSAYFLLENMLIKQFSYVLSCNSESLKYLQKTYFSTKGCYQLIRNTVDDEIFFPLSAQLKDQKRLQLISEMELSLKTRFITYVGRLHPQKDPLLLVRSVAELDDANIHLLMIGVGELKEDIQLEIKNLGLNSQVTLLGSMNSREIADILRVSDLLALTSVYEGLPMVVLEALTCGIPIVSTDSGETSKLLTKKTGVIIPTRTPKSTADSLRTVLENPQCYPSQACTQLSSPYWARLVVSEIYNDMRERWKDRQQLSEKTFSTA